MLTTIGFVFLILGIVCVIAGYTVAPAALRPGWGLVILAVVLIILGYLIPIVTNTHDYSTAAPFLEVH